MNTVFKKINPGRKIRTRSCNDYIICQVILFTTYALIAGVAVFLVATLDLKGTAIGLAVCGIALLYNIIVHILLKRKIHYVLAVYLLLLFYLLLASGVIWQWGIDARTGILLLGLVIVLAGILLSAFDAIFVAIVAGIITLVTQGVIVFNGHILACLTRGAVSNFDNVLACCIVFIVLVLSLYIRERERSLAQIKQAEVVLLEQNAALKSQNKKHMSDLRQMQLEDMTHMYRFAELGQQGVTLLHDLANHVAALKLELDVLPAKQHAKAIQPMRNIIQRLDDIVENACQRLHGSSCEQKFNLVGKIGETISLLQDKAKESHTVIDWQPPSYSCKYRGDPASLCHVVAIITNNAIDAYGALDTAAPGYSRQVAVCMQRTDTHFVIRIGDWGKGLPKSSQKSLFQPFHSTKKSGLGLGLYIAKHTMEIQFSGTIELNSSSDHTEFIIKLPRANQ